MSEKVVTNCIDRISIAVFDVVKAEQDYCRLFGWEVAERYTDLDLQINVTCFAVGPTLVELMEGGDEWYELLDNQGNVVLSGKGGKPDGRDGPSRFVNAMNMLSVCSF